MLFPPAPQFFSSLIDGCLKYKNKEKPKTGLRLDPRLNYDVKIGPKPGPRGVKKSGPVGAGAEMQGSRVATLNLSKNIVYVHLDLFVK